MSHILVTSTLHHGTYMMVNKIVFCLSQPNQDMSLHASIVLHVTTFSI